MRRPFSNRQRWALVVAAREVDRGGSARFVLPFSGIALVLGAGLAPLPTLARVVLFLIGVAAVVAGTLARRRTVRDSGVYLEAVDQGLSRITPEGTKSLVDWNAPFGVSLLASYGRAHALLAFTTPAHTRYVPVRIEGRSEHDDETFARIAVLADVDLVDAVAHDAALEPHDGAALLEKLAAKDEGSLGRVFSSDGRGAPMSLDRATLAIGSRSFDLTSAIEWRPFMFHESTGQAAPLYQATWIRQGTTELVLVAPMPSSIVPRNSEGQPSSLGRLGRALTRDIKLMQAPSEPPPARELRVAIDRPFMMAVRHALDGAPLALRVPAEMPQRPPTERSSVA